MSDVTFTEQKIKYIFFRKLLTDVLITTMLEIITAETG